SPPSPSSPSPAKRSARPPSTSSPPPDTADVVIHLGLITDLQNKRRGTASTLTRGEKLGCARAGSIRPPLRPGGGVIFGPKPRDWSIKINKKEKQLAISTALSSIASENMMCVEEFREKFEKPRTREFIEAMRWWGLDPKEKVMFLVSDLTDNLEFLVGERMEAEGGGGGGGAGFDRFWRSYHGALPSKDRRCIQELFCSNKIRVARKLLLSSPLFAEQW
ncbi:60S ribosomal protein L4, partial [Turnera subulata]